jgi:hypothetical protein
LLVTSPTTPTAAIASGNSENSRWKEIAAAICWQWSSRNSRTERRASNHHRARCCQIVRIAALP